MESYAGLVSRIMDVTSAIGKVRAALIALTGIDASGKGYVAHCLERDLQHLGLRVAVINIDGWLNLPAVRFNEASPAQHFYEHAIRFDEMFGKLVLPLKETRSVRVEADFAEETAHAFRRRLYCYTDVDAILLEGIYLLKRQFRSFYDLSCWIECTFETALERALARGQEGLPADETIRAYQSIYFPAQEIHFHRDAPITSASITISNDPRIRNS